MSELFASGRIVDFILALVVVEAIALLGYARSRGGPAPRALLLGLLPGVLLLLALRAALRDAPWPAIALCLAGAFGAHVADLGQRLGRDR